MRLAAALNTLVVVVLLADWLGWGHQWLGITLLAGAFWIARALPERGWRLLVGALLWASVAIAVLAVLQLRYTPRPPGPFRSPNLLGWFSVLCFFLGLQTHGRRSEARKPGYTAPGLYAAANLFTIALSQSRGAILALGAGLCAMLVRRRPFLAALAAASAALACILIRPGLQEARLQIWEAGLLAASMRPLLGWGQGGVAVGTLTSFYSVPLDLLLAAGILGLAAGAWLFIEGVVTARREPATLGFLAAWLVGGLFIYGTPATLVPLFLVLGHLSRQHREGDCGSCERGRDGADQAEPIRLDARPAQAQ